MPEMCDTFGRRINYLRVSVTDLCNLRCRYCMPAGGVKKMAHADMMSEDETITAIEAAVGVGVFKLRIPGGAPLVNKNFISLCRRAAAIPGVRELCLTTNGTLLPHMAEALKDVGVSRLNISLDTLNPQKYAWITRGGMLSDVLRGLEAAKKSGFTHTKINAVLIGGFNDNELAALADLTRSEDIDVRFIELMPMPAAVCEFGREAFMTAGEAAARLPHLIPLPDEPGELTSHVRLYKLPRARGRVGFITPMSHNFCASCDRIRITADGRVKPCLHSPLEFSIPRPLTAEARGGLDRDEMKRVIMEAVAAKPARHDLQKDRMSAAGRTMNGIGG